MNKDIPVGKKMTDKEKIAQIIAEHLCPQGKSHKTLYGAGRMCYSHNNFAECEKVSECVDALIAAGIGDISEWKHRAEVAERPLHCLARSFAEALCKNGNAENLIQGFIQDAQKQAEKELAEEKKE